MARLTRNLCRPHLHEARVISFEPMPPIISLCEKLAASLMFKARSFMELKAFSPTKFAEEVAKLKVSLPVRLAREQLVDSSVCAVLLVVATVEKVGTGWGQPKLCACLCKKAGGSADDWVDVVGKTEKKGRGRCKESKPLLRSVLNGMEWVKTDDGKKVGLLKHFFSELGLNNTHTEERAQTCNRHLKSVGHADQVTQQSVPGMAGSPPFVASKQAFRVLYDFF